VKECPNCGNDGNWEVEMSQAIQIEKLRTERDKFKTALEELKTLTVKNGKVSCMAMATIVDDALKVDD
jgi:hypothetical protein